MSHKYPTRKLREVCEFISEKNTEYLPYIGMEDIESGTGKFNGSKEPKKVKSTTVRFDTKTVLYGKLRPYLNKVFVPNFIGHCTTEFVPIQPDQDLLSREWLFYWLSSSVVVEEMTKNVSGARMPRANI